MAKAAGATFVARTTTYHVNQMIKILKEAIIHEGFSVVEVLSQCPTYFGRKNRMGAAPDMMELMKENTTTIGSKAKAENPDLIERGIFLQIEKTEYCSECEQVIEKAMKEGGA
jgi:2-oxoglutarate ferredoxin oxidoreductase subunit beta